MRLFPRTARRRALAATLAAVAIGGLIAPSAEAKHGDHRDAQLHHQQKQAQQKVNRASKDLDGASKQLLAATGALHTAQRQLAGARSHLADVTARLEKARAVDRTLRAQLARSRARLARARADLDAGQASLDAQRDKTRSSILQSYLQGDPQLQELQSLVEGESLDSVTTDQAYGAAVNQLQISDYQSLQSLQVLLQVRAQDVKDATAQVAAKEKEAAEKLAEIRDLRTQAVSARNQVRQLVDHRLAAQRRAARAKAHDARKVAAAKRQEEKIRKLILARAGHDANRRVSSTGGMFVPPVANSYITSPYGWRIHPIYGYWGLHDGDDLHAPCGTPEVAVDTGKVVSEYYSSVWGNRLYLDLGNINGHNYTAIYNHITSYKAHVGQVVGRGETVAYAGTTGWSTACHLHFTIMKDGTAVDPTSLIGM